LGYIGRTPTGSILTGADIADGSISTAKLADTAVSTAKIADTAISTAKIADDAVTSAKSTAMNVGDSWRLTTGFTATTGGIQDITSNWERDDTYSFGQLGTGMTESSGIFTFPSTGIYLIQYFVTIGHNADIAYFTGMIRSTANNSAYNTCGEANASTSAVGAVQYQMASMQKIIDCSNTTNVKVKFSYDTSDGVSVQGSSAGNKTYMTFQRLGDT